MTSNITPEQQLQINALMPVMSRYQAAEILRHLAHDGEAGMYPEDITAHEVGVALGRLHKNCQEEDPLQQIIAGYQAYQSDFQRRMDISKKP